MSLAIAGKIDLPPKPVIISIDDGYLDNYTNAFPILQRYGQTATIFLATDFVKRGDYNYMTWEMVAEMINAGISVEPHSRTHADLRNQSREALIYEIQGPQRDLEPHLGYTPRFFAYPSGQYDQYTIEILEESGYWGAVTTQGGWWHGYEDRYEWTRLRVRNNTPLGDFIFFINRYLE
jgi:peptidoglycan/xylan/chitin deacetylase (PgdA/CDA1 family)